MGAPETATEETRFVRYRHRERPDIEYDVEMASWTNYASPYPHPRQHNPDGPDFVAYRIRTIRNLSLKEDIHQPAYTYMPADRFLETYERVRS